MKETSRSLFCERMMSPYCIKPDCSIAARFPQPAHETDFVGLTRRSPHRITLRVCGCGSLPAHIRILAMLSHRFMLIHVCATYCISPRAASHCVLPRRYRYSHSRDASHRFMLIPVIVAKPQSALRTLRVCSPPLACDGLIQYMKDCVGLCEMLTIYRAPTILRTVTLWRFLNRTGAVTYG